MIHGTSALGENTGESFGGRPQENVAGIEARLAVGGIGAEVEVGEVGQEALVTGVLERESHGEPAGAAKGSQHALCFQDELAVAVGTHLSTSVEQLAAFWWHHAVAASVLCKVSNLHVGNRFASVCRVAPPREAWGNSHRKGRRLTPQQNQGGETNHKKPVHGRKVTAQAAE